MSGVTTRSKENKNVEYSVVVEVSIEGDSRLDFDEKLVKFDKGKNLLFNEENSQVSTRSTRSQTQSEAERQERNERLSESSSGEFFMITKEQFTEEFNSGIKKVKKGALNN